MLGKYKNKGSYGDSYTSSKIQGGGLYVFFENNRKKIEILAAAVILAIAATAAIMIGQNLLQKSPGDKTEQVVTEEGVKLEQLRDDDLRDRVDQLIYEKKYISAEKLIEFQEGSKRYELQLLLASVYMNQESYPDALRIYRQIAEDNPDDWRPLRYIAEVNTRLENKKEAIDNYKKALELLENQESLSQDNGFDKTEFQINHIKQKIKTLERN